MKDISKADLENNIPLITRKDFKRDIKVKGITMAGEDLVVMAGPCTVESKSQVLESAQAVKEAGAQFLRGGVFKPLTFPYGEPLAQPDAGSDQPKVDRRIILKKADLFRAAERRLGYLKSSGEKYGLAVISEVLYAETVAMMEDFVDMFQVGYRHMFNMDLIEALSRTKKPVMIKRHYGESLRSLLGVGEHFEARGKHDIVFCERGVSVPHTHNVESRAILDIQAIPALNEYAPSVPVFIDPSHATFKRSYVASMSMAGVAAGADGLLIEVHPQPEKAWVDPLQALGFEDFKKLMKKLKAIRQMALQG